MPEYFFHPSAIIDEGCEIGSVAIIWHFSQIMPNSIIGKNCNIWQNIVISPFVEVDNKLKFDSEGMAACLKNNQKYQLLNGNVIRIL